MTNKTNIQTIINPVSGDETANRFVPEIMWEHVVRFARETYQPAQEIKHNIIVLKDHPLSCSRHTHTFYEIIYVLAKNGTHLINYQPEALHSGDLYILPPFAQHSLHDDACITIMIHPDAFENIFSGMLHGQDCLGEFLMNSLYRNDSHTYLLFRSGANAQDIRHVMMEMLEVMKNGNDYTDRILSGMLLLLSTSLIRTHQNVVRTTSENDRNNEILSLIYEQYDTITLAALAERLHYTVPYCSKYLKTHLGCNFSELLGKIRFHKAENLLMNSGMTVSQISQTLGYENPENFTRAFKHRYRMTPSQYRITQLSPCAEIPPRLKFEGVFSFSKTVYLFRYFPFIIK